MATNICRRHGGRRNQERGPIPWRDRDEWLWEGRLVECPHLGLERDFAKARQRCTSWMVKAQQACVNGAVYPMEERPDG